eukprot:SAG31_NODE_13032_length_898_cov_0.982478_2_plen_55_part_00
MTEFSPAFLGALPRSLRPVVNWLVPFVREHVTRQEWEGRKGQLFVQGRRLAAKL